MDVGQDPTLGDGYTRQQLAAGARAAAEAWEGAGAAAEAWAGAGAAHVGSLGASGCRPGHPGMGSAGGSIATAALQQQLAAMHPAPVPPEADTRRTAREPLPEAPPAAAAAAAAPSRHPPAPELLVVAHRQLDVEGVAWQGGGCAEIEGQVGVQAGRTSRSHSRQGCVAGQHTSGRPAPANHLPGAFPGCPCQAPPPASPCCPPGCGGG